MKTEHILRTAQLLKRMESMMNVFVETRLLSQECKFLSGLWLQLNDEVASQSTEYVSVKIDNGKTMNF